MKRASIVMSLLALLPAGAGGQAALATHATPDVRRDGAPVVGGRSLGLATAPNARDLGGYDTRDGRRVQTGLLLRSDQLNLLSDGDLARLSALGVGTVIDLRTDAERARDPDRVPAGARHLILDMAAGQDPQPFMAKLARGEGRAAMIDLYRAFPTSAPANAALATLLTTAADAKAPVLFHCTAGKDRTGWASAVLLSLLGVPRETVIADYLESNARLAAKNAAIFAQVKPPYSVAQLRPVFTVERAYIDAAFAEMDRRYGSVERYAREGLKLDRATIAALRARYLIAA